MKTKVEITLNTKNIKPALKKGENGLIIDVTKDVEKKIHEIFRNLFTKEEVDNALFVFFRNDSGFYVNNTTKIFDYGDIKTSVKTKMNRW